MKVVADCTLAYSDGFTKRFLTSIAVPGTLCIDFSKEVLHSIFFFILANSWHSTTSNLFSLFYIIPFLPAFDGDLPDDTACLLRKGVGR